MDALVSTEHLLTVAEAARFAGVSEKTIYRALDARRLKHACIGQSKCYRIRREWLDDWIDDSAIDVEPAFSAVEIKSPIAPPRTARGGPYAQEQTPRRGILK